jgi:hypothetical protein
MAYLNTIKHVQKLWLDALIVKDSSHKITNPPYRQIVCNHVSFELVRAETKR